MRDWAKGGRSIAQRSDETTLHTHRPVLARSLYLVALAAVLSASAALVAYRIDEPMWEAGHHGFIMTEYPSFAIGRPDTSKG